jgi:anti-sigma B factor antagonist
MYHSKVAMPVRKVGDKVAIVDIQGEVTATAETILMNAYNEGGGAALRAIILNFNGLEYMNSSGIGLLVTLLIRANRQKQHLLSYGLSDHYRQIFALTRLNDAIPIFNTEAEAVAAGSAM